MAYSSGDRIILVVPVRLYADAYSAQNLTANYTQILQPQTVYVDPAHQTSYEPAVIVRTGIYPYGYNLGYINIDENISNSVYFYDTQGQKQFGQVYVYGTSGEQYEAKAIYICDTDGSFKLGQT